MDRCGWTQKVFRLRKIPNHVASPRQLGELLGRVLGIQPDHVVIYSIARNSDPWEGLPTKVATLQFKSAPQTLQQSSNCREWELQLSEATGDKIILDTHFLGMTVLNDVPNSQHHSDCIAISGLASHPFGSWQPHNSDKSYMWIRDELPRAIPGVRTIIYGYDSALEGSNSFQSIGDIALGLIHHLKSQGWNLDSAKPIVFLAHSLGGLVLKQALVYLAEGGTSISSILSNLAGAIMFGVPSLGMHQSHLMAMVQGQSNDTLIQDLSRENGSAYLRQLNKSFEGISFTRTVQIFWAYETKESPTVVTLPDGSRSRNGPLAVLVNPDSATNHRNHDIKNKAFTVSINENHTNMVKFSRGDSNLVAIIAIISDLCGSQHKRLRVDSSPNTSSRLEHRHNNLIPTASPPPASMNLARETDEWVLRHFFVIFWLVKEQMNTIDSPDLDFRVDQIDDPFQDTFRWIFDLPLFSEWLQHGSGLFWIHGKPGSGKSTLMKYIFKSERTWELLHDWTRVSHEIRAGFFFHYRGSAIQKSFEGVLRSLIVQILAPHYKSFKRQYQDIQLEYRQYQAEHRQLEQARESVLETLIKSNSDKSRIQERAPEQHLYDLEDQAPENLQKRLAEIDVELLFMENTKLSEIASRAQSCLGVLETALLIESMENFSDDTNQLIIKLEKMLRQLLNQTKIPMELILFFDALDEFDGHLDMISRFLKGLVHIPPESKTRVKVCVSSRPWKQLHNHFSAHHNFALQDFTRADIEQFAARSLAALHIANPSIIPIASIITYKANGVFLWVKLAVQELSNAISTSAQLMSREQLEETLWKLPDDLQAFYDLIIERIDRSHRRQTYVLLELLVRQRENMTKATSIREAVLISACTTFQEARDMLNKDRVSSGDADMEEKAYKVRHDLTTWSGGLVELHGDYPQFMHQTILEYFMGLSFKRIVLGDLAPFITENGHSFYFKYWLSAYGHVFSFTDERYFRAQIAYHGVQSELTTGNSHIEFLRSIPTTEFRLFPSLHSSSANWGNVHLPFIVFNKLILCLQDWITASPDQLRNLGSTPGARYPLLSSLISDPLDTGSHERCLVMARLLLENGYSMDQDPDFFHTLLSKMCSVGLQLTGSTFEKGVESTFYKLAILALENGQSPNNPAVVPGTLRTPPYTALHIAPPEICVELVKRGSHVNAHDSTGLTPLDWLLAFPDKLTASCGTAWSIEWRYKKCMILVPAGSVLTDKGRKANWREALDEFEAKDYNARALRELIEAQGSDTWMSTLGRIFRLG